MDRLKTDYCQECFPAVPPLIVAAPGQGCLGGLAVSHLIPLINLEWCGLGREDLVQPCHFLQPVDFQRGRFWSSSRHLHRGEGGSFDIYSAFLTPPQEMADWRSLRPSDVLNALIRTVIINIMLIVLKKSDKRLSPPKCAKCKSTLPESQSHRRIPHWGKINYWRMAAPSTTTTSQRSLHCT